MSSERSDGPGSSESRRLKQSARARRALNAAVCRKLQAVTGGGGGGDDRQNEEETAQFRRQRYKEQRRLEAEEGPDITYPKDDVAEEYGQNGRVAECGSEAEDSESDGVSDEDEEESVVEIFERLVRESEERGSAGQVQGECEREQELMLVIRRIDMEDQELENRREAVSLAGTELEPPSAEGGEEHERGPGDEDSGKVVQDRVHQRQRVC